MDKYFLTLPEIPAGQDFARDSFWWKYRERFERPMRYKWKVKKSSEDWFDKQKNSAELYQTPFPPKPIFRRVSPLPQVWDGKDEKPGKVPRTGKE